MQRQCAGAAAVGRDHVIGMRHLQPAIVGLELARDQALAADRQQPLEIRRVGLEIDQLERGAVLVFHQHAIGRARTAAPAAAWPMLGHRDVERGELADLGVGDARRQRTVDDPGGEVPHQIDDARMRPLMARRGQFVQQPLDLGPHALERADGGKQGG